MWLRLGLTFPMMIDVVEGLRVLDCVIQCEFKTKMDPIH